MTDILIILVLIFFNGFFSLAEVALISARKNRIEAMAKEGSRSAASALKLMNDPDCFLSTAQVGITIVAILTGLFSGETFAEKFGEQLLSLGMDENYAQPVAQIIILVVVTYMSCELGELFPKKLGIDRAESMAKLTAPLMTFFSKIMMPVVWLLSKNTELIARGFNLNPENHNVTEEEIKSMIQEGTDSGEVQEVEQDIMERALALGDQTVEQVMTHRSDIVFLEASMKSSEVQKIITEDTYAAYPVIGDDPDEVIGVVTLKGLVSRLWQKDFSLRKILHKPLYFPENMTVYKALEELKRNKFNRALVVDEFGSVQGIIVLRDIMEGLVGQIPDENETLDIIENADHNSWSVSGQCQFYDFLAFFDEEDLYTPDYNTVGGLILDVLERIPMAGERLEWKSFEFRIVKMDGTRIDTLLVRHNPLPQTDSKGDGEKANH